MVNQYLCTFFRQKLTTALLESAEGRKRKYFLINLHERMLPAGLEPTTSGLILCSFVVDSTRHLYCLALHFALVFLRRFSIATTSLGEERVGLCAFRAFVCFAHDGLCLFSPSLGVRDWLRLVIVALPEVFFLPFVLLVQHKENAYIFRGHLALS